jgi:DnaA-homolog protein
MQQIALDIGLQAGPSFDNFVRGSNASALAHLRLWAQSARRAPVPTYLWGPAASGKTHLLRAAAAALRAQGQAVGWMDASLHEPPAFSEAWVAVLLDDTHLYTAVQQHAAFNWFVNAQTHQRWVLASGDAPPAQLKLREDLRTRLGWGDIFEVTPLSEPESRAALQASAQQRGLHLSQDVTDFLLTRFSRDMGSLMQLLNQLDGYALQNKRAITIPLIKNMLESL